MSLKLEDFRAALKGGVRTNLFRVIPTFPYGGNIQLASFLIKAASLPAFTVSKLEPAFRGRKLKLAGDRTIEDWTVDVYVDANFDARDVFENWSNAINGVNSNVGEENINAYMSDWRVEQLDRAGAVIKTYVFKNVWPISVGKIELSDSEGLATFNVELAVEEFSTNTTS